MTKTIFDFQVFIPLHLFINNILIDWEMKIWPRISTYIPHIHTLHLNNIRKIRWYWVQNMLYRVSCLPPSLCLPFHLLPTTPCVWSEEANIHWHTIYFTNRWISHEWPLLGALGWDSLCIQCALTCIPSLFFLQLKCCLKKIRPQKNSGPWENNIRLVEHYTASTI